MMNRWGNDGHGPGGDPSWLGGGDRADGKAPECGQGSGAFSSDFTSDFSQDQRGVQDSPTAADPDLPGRGRSQDAESMAPRFGEVAGDSARSEGRAQDAPWMSSFTGSSGEGQGRAQRGGSLVAQLIGLLGSSVGVIIFAVIVFRMGFDMWWILLFVGIPLISKIARLIRRNLGG
ncbi:hypothetical protein [Brachybacterium paraconglomeratum]|uniref:hypothetical protein n=1 Tax=Brachybacterium paraconglomeratum TaxID=173362 RepID=UPI0031E8D060